MSRSVSVVTPASERIGFRVEGTVQGVGFRPFVYRMALEHRIEGWVLNDGHGVLIHAVALPENLIRFEAALRKEAPPAARIERITRVVSPARQDDYRGGRFIIRDSHGGEAIDVAMPPDLAVCADCLREMGDPMDRRHLYPFINCTNCGPRYSIIEEIPYDRPHTTMRRFKLCAACQAEYENPEDRRFHAQPLACPECGPHLEFWDRGGKVIAESKEALSEAIRQLREGAILAVKGIGGFHLMCDAYREGSVEALRARKRRDHKPLAVMVPDIAAARAIGEISAVEEKLLRSPAAPIVLLSRQSGSRKEVSCEIASAVAPENPLLGVMLPYSPLHHLLTAGFGGVLVATSGNLSEEPICTDEEEAVKRLRGIADGFLIHNRPIARAVDDSVVRVMMDEPVVLRRARGYAPAPLSIAKSLPPVLAVGAHLKNTIAVTAGHHIFPSQHVGDLSTAAACRAFGGSIETLSQLYRTRPAAIACDLHPDYHSTLWAERQEIPLVRVQHHFAHVLSCMVENHLEGPVLGVAWDGTGYGTDGSIWGGEWLLVPCGGKSFERAGHLLPFHLPGGEAAIRRPALTAMGLLFAAYGEEAYELDEVFSVLQVGDHETRILRAMMRSGRSTPMTTSAGRLFDGVGALLGLGNEVAFEAQTAMKLEFLAMASRDDGCYDIRLRKRDTKSAAASPLIFDWTWVLRQIIADLRGGVATADIARRFHTTLAEGIAAVAREMPQYPVVLTGGCFQNKILTETTITCLRENGLEVYWHHVIPPNDGGIAVGQILAAAAEITNQE